MIDRCTLLGRAYNEHYFVVLSDDKKRVFFDSAWTRYYAGPGRSDIRALVEHITGYIECRCD